jgi:hypothetical protein
MRRECTAECRGRSCVHVIATTIAEIIGPEGSVLDDFRGAKYSEHRKKRPREVPKMRRVTVTACEELAECGSVDELKGTRGYMSAGQRRAFERCEGRAR